MMIQLLKIRFINIYLCRAVDDYGERQMNKVSLKPAFKDDLQTIWEMQISAFSDLLDKYQDYGMSPGLRAWRKSLHDMSSRGRFIISLLSRMKMSVLFGLSTRKIIAENEYPRFGLCLRIETRDMPKQQ